MQSKYLITTYPVYFFHYQIHISLKYTSFFLSNASQVIKLPVEENLCFLKARWLLLWRFPRHSHSFPSCLLISVNVIYLFIMYFILLAIIYSVW